MLLSEVATGDLSAGSEGAQYNRRKGGWYCESKNRKEESTWLVAELWLGLNRRIWEM